MYDILYLRDSVKRRVVVFVFKKELEARRQERRRARQMEYACRLGGIYTGLHEGTK